MYVPALVKSMSKGYTSEKTIIIIAYIRASKYNYAFVRIF